MRKIIIIWFRAYFLDYKYWRVTYTDNGETTRLLGYDVAYNLKEIYGGVLWIDYTVLD